MEIWQYAILFLIGIMVGFVNVMAGGGSLLTLPVMLFLGVPAPVANGTNRIAILAQMATAAVAFFRKGYSDFRLSLSLALTPYIPYIQMQIKPEDLKCWKCGAGLDYLLMPLSRSAHCKACEAALHVCRMCRFYDPRVAKQCREPVADAVKDKDRPNFCDYLELNPEAWEPADHSEADVAAADLNDLFGLDTGEGASGTSATSDQARQELDDLFDLKK